MFQNYSTNRRLPTLKPTPVLTLPIYTRSSSSPFDTAAALPRSNAIVATKTCQEKLSTRLLPGNYDRCYCCENSSSGHLVHPYGVRRRIRTMHHAQFLTVQDVCTVRRWLCCSRRRRRVTYEPLGDTTTTTTNNTRRDARSNHHQNKEYEKKTTIQESL